LLIFEVNEIEINAKMNEEGSSKKAVTVENSNEDRSRDEQKDMHENKAFKVLRMRFDNLLALRKIIAMKEVGHPFILYKALNC